MTAAVLGDVIEALADSTRELLRELAAVSAEGQALRRELELAWGVGSDDDERPTLIPEVDDELIEVIEIERRDTMRC
jgi:hypothetical protein